MKNIISLYDLEKNMEASITTVHASPKTVKRLADLGLTPNTSIKIVRKTLFCGPLEVQARGLNIALGKGIATKIFVRTDERAT